MDMDNKGSREEFETHMMSLVGMCNQVFSAPVVIEGIADYRPDMTDETLFDEVIKVADGEEVLCERLPAELYNMYRFTCMLDKAVRVLSAYANLDIATGTRKEKAPNALEGLLMNGEEVMRSIFWLRSRITYHAFGCKIGVRRGPDGIVLVKAENDRDEATLDGITAMSPEDLIKFLNRINKKGKGGA